MAHECVSEAGGEKNEMIKHDEGIKSECGELLSSPVTKRKSQFKFEVHKSALNLSEKYFSCLK